MYASPALCPSALLRAFRSSRSIKRFGLVSWVPLSVGVSRLVLLGRYSVRAGERPHRGTHLSIGVGVVALRARGDSHLATPHIYATIDTIVLSNGANCVGFNGRKTTEGFSLPMILTTHRGTSGAGSAQPPLGHVRSEVLQDAPRLGPMVIALREG